eukprot:gene5505-5559_t
MRVAKRQNGTAGAGWHPSLRDCVPRADLGGIMTEAHVARTGFLDLHGDGGGFCFAAGLEFDLGRPWAGGSGGMKKGQGLLPGLFLCREAGGNARNPPVLQARFHEGAVEAGLRGARWIMETRTAHALIRFGLGRKGNEAVPSDPASWLARQLEGDDPALLVAGASATDGLLAIREQRRNRLAADNPVRTLFRAEQAKYVENLLTTDVPFRERLVTFWANHFTVSLKRGECAAVAHAFVREAIRPHVTGRFGDMLLAVMRHPAMLLYLDNAASFGPDSFVGSRQRRGLNENLARECLELHTVTPAAGYTQEDVTNFAKVLTGWSVEIPKDPAGWVYRHFTHQPGLKVVMGRSYDGGEDEGIAALAWLATHPATYRNIAMKLVRHFVSDTPPEAAVRRVEAVLARSGGDLKAASLELIRVPEAWEPLSKLRSPQDYVVAVLRAVDLPKEKRPPDVPGLLSGLGQPILTAPLPNGWPDVAADWAGSEAMLRRIDWAYGFTGRVAALDPEAVGQAALDAPRRVSAGCDDAVAGLARISKEIAVAHSSMRLSRRGALLGLATSFTLGRASLAVAAAPTDRRFVVVILRGALDGLSAVVPYGDPNLGSLRAALKMPEPGAESGLLDLGGFYGLHPALSGMHAMYRAGELLPVHAVAGPYRIRSHFEAQDYLEYGADHAMRSGWLNRVASLMPQTKGGTDTAFAVGSVVPLVLRGPQPVGSWLPKTFAQPDADLYARLAALHHADPVTGPAVAEGLKERGFSAAALAGTEEPANKYAFQALCASAGKLLAAKDGARIAALEIGGWDTHAAQLNRLTGPLRQLDEGMVALKGALGEAWGKTAVLVMTEFGRTVRTNGTGGTDHGTGSVAFVLGGAVSGGRVQANWPGLSQGNLLENRDLQPTADLRALTKGVLGQHFGFDAAGLSLVFPDSERAAALPGLLRA